MNQDIIKKIELLEPIYTTTEYQHFLNYFLSPTKEEDRLLTYKKVKALYNLNHENDAKYLIIKTLFSHYIISELELAQENCNDNIEISNEIIKSLSPIKNLFKNYDIKGFNEYLCEIIGDTSPVEIQKIFEQTYFNQNDISLLNNTFQKILTTPRQLVKNTSQFFERELINHPLIELLSVSRNKDYHLQQETYGKFSKLANAIQEFRLNSKTEGLDGAILYLAYLDTTIGLNNIKGPNDLVAFIKKINNNKKINQIDLEILMDISFRESKNFIEANEGGLQYIKNGENTLKATGAVDRNYENKVFVHSATGIATNNTQSNQLSRGYELYVNHLILQNKFTQDNLPTSIQISKQPSLPGFLANSPLTFREQVILSNLNNFSEVLLLQLELQNNNKDIDLLSKAPLHIYTDKIVDSQQFLTEYLNIESYEEKINQYLQATLDVMKKIDYLTNSTVFNKVNATIEKTELIYPLLKIATTLLYEIESHPENKKIYNITTNIYNFLEQHKDILLNTNNRSLKQDLNVFFRNANSIISENNLNTHENHYIKSSLLSNNNNENVYQNLHYEALEFFSSEQNISIDNLKKFLQFFESKLDFINLHSLEENNISDLRQLKKIANTTTKIEVKELIISFFNNHLYPMAENESRAFIKAEGKGKGMKIETLDNAIKAAFNEDKNFTVHAFYSANYHTAQDYALFSIWKGIGKSDFHNQRISFFTKLAEINDKDIRINNYSYKKQLLEIKKNNIKSFN